MSRQATKGDLIAIARMLGLSVGESLTSARLAELCRHRAREVQAAIAVLHPDVGALARGASIDPSAGDRLVGAFLEVAEQRRADNRAKNAARIEAERATFQPVRTPGDAAREPGVNVADVSRRKS